jgi:RND family efflux transporter MFP subunit
MTFPECDQIQPLSTRTKALVILACLLILGVGIGSAAYFVKNRPAPPTKPPQPFAPPVSVIAVQSGRHTVAIEALGTVIPARQTAIRAEVAGIVRDISPAFIPGGTIAKGSPFVTLDDRDFRLDVAAREADLASSRASLDLEMGYQQVARHEWGLLKRSGEAPGDNVLALRKPQLAQARAKVRQAETALDLARLNLGRTVIRAPFTALVLSKDTEIGARVSITDALATLVDAREFWVEATLPVDRLPWIELPATSGQGSEVRIRSQASGAERTGRVLRLLGDLETQGRLARVLVSVPEPLEAKPAPMLLGEYVRLEIEGRTLEDVTRIPRAALRDNDTVWTVRDGRLRISPVTVAWRDAATVFVSQGLQSEDRVVTSELGAPVQDMPVAVHAGR